VINELYRGERFFSTVYEKYGLGKLKEVPGVFSQGATLQELEENIQDAYRMIMSEQEEYEPSLEIKSKELSFQV